MAAEPVLSFVELPLVASACLVGPDCAEVTSWTCFLFFSSRTDPDPPTFWPPAIGNESPRNFPLLATPTPHVNVVLYPEQSLPSSKHCEQ
jgi:hypothetical protein